MTALKPSIVKQLEKNGYGTGEILRYWDGLVCDELAPQVAYIAVDCCFWHGADIVSNWLRLAKLRSLSAPGTAEYIIELRRRSLRSRPDWPAHRHVWTNHINRATIYAGKFAALSREPA
jgi:lysozyme family protein